MNFGDRDITEWDTTEGYLYGIKIGEIRPAPKLGYIRGWVTVGGYKRGMTVFAVKLDQALRIFGKSIDKADRRPWFFISSHDWWLKTMKNNL